MVRRAVLDAEWIRLSTWETEQPVWMRTRATLDAYAQQIEVIRAGEAEPPAWAPPVLRAGCDEVGLKLICGADLLETFSVPGLWAESDVRSFIRNFRFPVAFTNFLKLTKISLLLV